MLPSRPRTWVRTGVTLTLAFHALYAAWLLLPLPRHVLLLGDDVLETLGALIATLFCFFGGFGRTQNAPARRIALVCGLGILCYTLQQVYIIFPDFAHRAAPVSRLVADIVSLSTYPLLLLGIWQLPRRPLSLSSHLRISLDGLMIITAVLTFSWYFILGPSILLGHGSLESKIVSIAYPLMDLLLVACLLLLGGRTKQMEQVISPFPAGLFCIVAADSLFMYLALRGLLHSGTLLDIGWSLGFMLVGVAASEAQPTLLAAEDEPECASALWKSLLPYALLPCVALLALYTQQTQGRLLLRHGVLWGGAVLVGLILARQVLEILENRELNGRLETLAMTDPLTGLVNHRVFHKRLAEEAERARLEGRTLAVAMMDLDNFKFFNDVYGHKVGDDVLRQVARALAEVAHSYDTAARFGGDEFALLMPQPPSRTGQEHPAPEDLRAHIAERLAGLSYLPPGSETPIPLTISVGIALFPGDADTRLEVLEIADARLRRSKTGGSDRPVDYFCQNLAHSVAGFSMLNALVTAVDTKDRYTRRHSEDVLAYSLQTAEQMGLDERTRHTLQVAALLHDVGKIGVPDAVLRKPGKLTEEEYQAIQQHPMMGAVIVGAVPGFEYTLDVVRHHHERWDGKGYPFGLCGDETLFLARLVAVADAFSAMTTDRPYRKGIEREKALSVLEAGAGTQWDPECVQALRQAYSSTETLLLAA